jgi:hypothetical protein
MEGQVHEPARSRASCGVVQASHHGEAEAYPDEQLGTPSEPRPTRMYVPRDRSRLYRTHEVQQTLRTTRMRPSYFMTTLSNLPYSRYLSPSPYTIHLTSITESSWNHCLTRTLLQPQPLAANPLLPMPRKTWMPSPTTLRSGPRSRSASSGIRRTQSTTQALRLLRGRRATQTSRRASARARPARTSSRTCATSLAQTRPPLVPARPVRAATHRWVSAAEARIGASPAAAAHADNLSSQTRSTSRVRRVMQVPRLLARRRNRRRALRIPCTGGAGAVRLREQAGLVQAATMLLFVWARRRWDQSQLDAPRVARRSERGQGHRVVPAGTVTLRRRARRRGLRLILAMPRRTVFLGLHNPSGGQHRQPMSHRWLPTT